LGGSPIGAISEISEPLFFVAEGRRVERLHQHHGLLGHIQIGGGIRPGAGAAGF
jgi:hypothetical protein